MVFPAFAKKEEEEEEEESRMWALLGSSADQLQHLLAVAKRMIHKIHHSMFLNSVLGNEEKGFPIPAVKISPPPMLRKATK